MLRFALLVAAAVHATAAVAADKPVVGPAPSWVRPLEAPVVKADGEAAVRVLLDDEQLRFAPGRTEIYGASVLRIQTPQGLEAGNIAFSWRPETDSVTVHKLLIRRGSQTLDILAGQNFTVMRREANLENAMIDGVLTASIQPEGLQVGDVVEFAATTTSIDPAVKGHVEQMAAAWNEYPIARAHLRAEWPSSLPIRVRQTKALPPLRMETRGGITSAELSLDNVEPPFLPNGAPMRYALHRLIEFTDFRSWSDMGALLAPYYTRAATLPPGAKLLAEVERIRRLSSDPKVRAEAALALVQDRIRYVYVGLNDGALVPADAETTWSRRFGDCKAKTAMLLALLGSLGIEAEPVAVSSSFGDGIDARLPMIGHFDHVLVRAKIGGQTYWLDGTRQGDRKLDAARVPALRWGLPLRAGAQLVAVMPRPLERPASLVTLEIDARDGVTAPARARAELLITGDGAIETSTALANMSAEARDRALREFWKNRYGFVEPSSVAISFDADRQEARLTLDGTARMSWRGKWITVPDSHWRTKPDIDRQPGPDDDAPYLVAYPAFERTVTTIRLPAGFTRDNIYGADVDRVVAGVEYRRRSTLEDNVLTVDTSARSIVPEFPASEVATAKAALREFRGTSVSLGKPRGHRRTGKEIAALIEATPDTAEGLVDRANALLDTRRFDEALADVEKALKLAPSNSEALALRGLTLVWKQEFAKAAEALNAAEAVAPRNVVIHRARGMMAQLQERPADAVAAYTRAIEIGPDDLFALEHRAEALAALGERERALADAAAAIKIDPSAVDLYLLRANLLRREKDKAVAEADALLTANPDDAYAHVVAARILERFEMRDAAMKAVERSIAIQPTALAYLTRADVRPRIDYVERIADLDKAAQLDPENLRAIAAKAEVQEEQGDHKAAIKTWTKAAEANPTEGGFLVQRGIAYARTGQMALAEKDFAAGRAKAVGPSQLNTMCWTKATAGIALESALVDCNAALAGAPGNAAYLDSRGLVLLRLGRLDEAIASYDAALAKEPTSAASLFGRAVAWARKGDKAKSDADLAAAIKADADVQTEFKSYGVTL